MATFERRGKFWRVKVRRAGLPVQTQSFNNKALAQQWARSVEADIDKGITVDRRTAERTSLAEILERYRREVTPTKRGAADENRRLQAMAQRPFARIRMSALTSSHLAAYRDERLKVVSSATVNREFNVLSHAIETARRDNGRTLRRAHAGRSQAFLQAGRAPRGPQRARASTTCDMRPRVDSSKRGCVMEVASVTGHKTLQMLKRYTHLSVSNLATRLG